MNEVRSQSIAKLAEALSKAQGVLGSAKKEAENPYFKSKYADLAAVIAAAKDPLSKNGLSVTQTTILGENNTLILVTSLMHSSGEWVCSYYPILPVKNDPQGIGSAMSYARRYCYMAIIGMASEDDDGNAASGKIATIIPAFKNAAARNKFCKEVLGQIAEARIQENLTAIRSMHQAKLDEMANGDENDVLGLEEVHKKYQEAKSRISGAEGDGGTVKAETRPAFLRRVPQNDPLEGDGIPENMK